LVDPATADPPTFAELFSHICHNVVRVVRGKDDVVHLAVMCMIAEGHLLVEDVPGVGKTSLAKALARSVRGEFRRIQFTPDLLPADLTGTQIYRPASGTFETRAGPIVTSVLLADEINRAPAKVQSALLEAMQDGQITVGDDTIMLPDPFWVLATQNPIEHEGTYPLPEAQLDRFLMQIDILYPELEAERRILLETTGVDEAKAANVLNPERLREIQMLIRRMPVPESVVEAILKLVREDANAAPEVEDEAA